MKLLSHVRFVIGFCIMSIAGSVNAQVDLGSQTSKTPYDPYLAPIWPVFRQLSGRADLETAAKLVRQGKALRYSYSKSQPYVPQSPEETEAKKSGDCKAKSLWLASKLNDRNVRFVIGKARLVSSISHAWLIWQGPEGWMILDATNYSSPLYPARISSSEFIPTYSYSPGGKYSHRVSVAGAGAKNGDHL